MARHKGALSTAAAGVVAAVLGHPVNLVVGQRVDGEGMTLANRLAVLLAPCEAMRTLFASGALLAEESEMARVILRALAPDSNVVDIETPPEMLQAQAHIRRVVKAFPVAIRVIADHLAKHGAMSVAEQAQATRRTQPAFAALLESEVAA